MKQNQKVNRPGATPQRVMRTPTLQYTFLLFTFLSLGIILSMNFVLAVQSPVNLGTAESFVILTKSGITNVPPSAITGNIGTSPITGASITGLDCSEVTGLIYTVDAAGPACRTTDATLLGLAISDMETAYADAQARTIPDTTELGAGDISGLTLTPGLHKWSSSVLINAGGTPDAAGVTLNCQGNASAVFIFQIAQDLTLGNGAQITLQGGCQAGNIFWAVVEDVTLGTTSVFKGTILAQNAGGALDAIALATGATLNGRAFAQKAVTLQSNTIVYPVVNTGSPVLTTLTLTPSQVNLTLGATQQFNATGFDQYGAPLSANITYATNNATLATVNASGFATTLSLGTVIITATSGSVNDTSSMTITPVPVPSAPASTSTSSSGSSGGGGGKLSD